MVRFILNNREISTAKPCSMTVLDFLRSRERITSVKPGCRTGSCGSCLVLAGESDGGAVIYRPLNSCLLPLEEADGKHIVTAEGLKREQSDPVPRAMSEQGAVQCGYCTPGIVISLTAFLLNSPCFDESLAATALDGNLCRCTGYQGIRRAAGFVCQYLSDVPEHSADERVKQLVKKQVLPAYFLEIPNRLQKIRPQLTEFSSDIPGSAIVAGGGTILWQKSENLSGNHVLFLSRRKELNGVRIENNRCHIGAATPIEAIRNSAAMQKIVPTISQDFAKIASTPVRYRATVGGNIVNASPVGDLSIFFLALDASLHLSAGKKPRTIFLKDFFSAYKEIDKQEKEIIEHISFPLPENTAQFNFERVCRHTDADVPGVNSAMLIRTENGHIREVRISAGGCAPVPLCLARTADYLTDKEISADTVHEAGEIAQSEISPISDIRGSADYKRLLLRQLIYAHFVTLFPDDIATDAVF